MLTKKRIEVGDVFTNSSGCVAVVIERKNYSEIFEMMLKTINVSSNTKKTKTRKCGGFRST